MSTLVHCDSRLLVDPVGLLLAFAQDNSCAITEVSRSEWNNTHKTLSFTGTTPYLFLDNNGGVISDPAAVYRFVCQKHKLLPASLLPNLQATSVIEQVYDLLTKSEAARLRCIAQGFSPEETHKVVGQFLSQEVPQVLKSLAAHYAPTQGEESESQQAALEKKGSETPSQTAAATTEPAADAGTGGSPSCGLGPKVEDAEDLLGEPAKQVEAAPKAQPVKTEKVEPVSPRKRLMSMPSRDDMGRDLLICHLMHQLTEGDWKTYNLMEKMIDNHLSDIYEVCSSLDSIRTALRLPQVVEEEAEVPELVGVGVPSAANPIRWAFAIGNVPFCYRYVTPETENIPMLKVGQDVIYSRTGMLSYAAHRAGLVPADSTTEAIAWSIVGALNSLLDLIGESKKAARTGLKKELPETLMRVDKMVASGQDVEGHVVGGRLSFVDLWAAMVYQQLCLDTVGGRYLKSLQTSATSLRRTYDMVMNIERVRLFDYRLPQRVPLLIYFDIPARAESIRLMFHIGNIAFEDRRLSRDEWLDRYKSLSPTGQCPILEVDNRLFVETKAIITYAAERAGLMPPTPMGRVAADMLHSAFSRVLTEQSKIHTVPKGAERDAMRANIRDNLLPPVLSMIENLASRDQHPAGYLVDNQLSWVDCYIAAEWQFMTIYRYLPEKSRDLYPCLGRAHDLVFSLPAVKDYLNQRMAATASPTTGASTPGAYSP